MLNVGAFNGGHTNNVICDYVKMFLSLRTWSDALTEKMERRIRETCEGVATMCGGSAKVTVTKLLPYVLNNEVMTEKLKETAYRLLGQENVIVPQRTLGGEDFAFITRVKPSVLFRLGVTNEENPDTKAPLHNGHFDLDERCFETGIDLFINFVLENQDGITF